MNYSALPQGFELTGVFSVQREDPITVKATKFVTILSAYAYTIHLTFN